MPASSGGIVRRTLALFEPRDRRRLYLVFASVLAMAMLEVAGIASIMPFLTVVSNPELIHTQPLLTAVWEWGGFASERRFLLFLGAVVFGLVLATNVVAMVSIWLIHSFSWEQNHRLSMRLLASYLGQPWEYFLSRNTADMGTQILNEVQSFVGSFLRPLLMVGAQGTAAVAIVLLLVLVDPLLAVLVTGVVGGAYAILYATIRRRLARNGQTRKRANKARFRAANEALGGMKDVKVRGLGSAFVEKFGKPSSEFSRVQTFQAVIGQIPRNALEIVAFGAVILILLYQLAVREDVAQVIPVVGLYAFAGYRLMPKAMQVYAAVVSLRFHGYILGNLEEDLIALAKSREVEEKAELPAMRERVALEDVTYQYPTAERASLDGLSLEIPFRASVALVGSTGSGKTTTVDVLLGLLKPQAGALVVDGRPLEDATRPAWRRQCGYVPQHIFLTDDSVTANIAFGVEPDRVDAAAVERAAQIANIHGFIESELPQGYATVVGERGVRLSGGQRQRIGIARALYHDPEVLFFDEATSALDNVTERAIMDAMGLLAGKKTLVTIAHRLSTVRHCDRIFLLEQGRLVAEGTFEELISMNDTFRAMAEGESATEAESA